MDKNIILRKLDIIIDFALEVKDYIEKVDEEALFRYNLNKIDDIEKDLPF